MNRVNTYASLPAEFYQRVAPTPVRAPRLLLWNEPLARELQLDPAKLSSAEEKARVFAGNTTLAEFEPIALASGAGHDAMALVPLCDTGMLFLRCKDGLSHHPDESITAADADACVRALLSFLRSFEPASTR